jgi:hypothetical protein
MKPRRRDFIGAMILVLVLLTLVAVIVGGNIPAA